MLLFYKFIANFPKRNIIIITFGKVYKYKFSILIKVHLNFPPYVHDIFIEVKNILSFEKSSGGFR